MLNESRFPFLIEVPGVSDQAIEKLLFYFNENKQWTSSILNTYGAILFRGGKINAKNYATLISKLNFDFTSYVGGDSPRTKLNAKVYTSTEYSADQNIVLHNELSFSNTYPKYLFFYCDTPSKTGGETPIADSRILYKLFPEKLIREYQAKKLKYVMNLHNGHGFGKSWQQVFETNSKSEIEEILYNRNISFQWRRDEGLQVYEIVQPVFSHYTTKELMFISQAHQWHCSNLEPEVRASLLEYTPEQEFYHYVSYGDDQPLNISDLELTKEVINQIKIEYKWQQGDILFVDNLLCLHGRNSYIGNRKILVSMANSWL